MMEKPPSKKGRLVGYMIPSPWRVNVDEEEGGSQDRDNLWGPIYDGVISTEVTLKTVRNRPSGNFREITNLFWEFAYTYRRTAP